MVCIPIFARQRNVCDEVDWCEQTLTKLVNLPFANEVWGKVMFSQVFVCPRGGGGGEGWLPGMHHRSHDQHRGGGGLHLEGSV